MRYGYAAIALLMASGAVLAQRYPDRPVRLIVGAATGSTPDIVARAAAGKLAGLLGQQVVIENNAGGGGAAAAGIVAKAPPDGYTLLLGTQVIFAVLPGLASGLPYDVARSFASISQIGFASQVLVVFPGVRATNMEELLRIAREKPGRLAFASAGPATTAHLAGEMVNLLAGVSMTHLPQKGAQPAMLEAVAGRAQVFVTSPIAAGPHLFTGKLRAIATTGSKPNPVLPKVPLVSQTLPGYEITQWWGLSAPAKTPPPIVNLLHDAVARAVSDREVRGRLANEGAQTVGGTPRAYDAQIAAERKRLGNLFKQVKIALPN